MSDNLENFLKTEATHDFWDIDGLAFVRYVECVNPDAIDDDKWIDNGTSYIWKIGFLLIKDSEKNDSVMIHIAHERLPGAFQYIGRLCWNDGDNDEMNRLFRRYANLFDTLF